MSLSWVFRPKVKNRHRRLLQLGINADLFGSTVTGSMCKCRACGGRSSPCVPQPCHFAPVLFPLPLSSTDMVSNSCCLSLRWLEAATMLPLTRGARAAYEPRGKLAPSRAGHGLPPSQVAAYQVKAYQRDASVSSPYLLGRALCDRGRRLAGSCMFSLGKWWEWRAAAGGASAAGSADESHPGEGAETVRTTIALSLERTTWGTVCTWLPLGRKREEASGCRAVQSLLFPAQECLCTGSRAHRQLQL